MNNVVELIIPTPVQALDTDTPNEILRFAAEAFVIGKVALATLVEIRGGAARALGAHMAVAEDGRFCGYVSGGCVEAAVATEALLTMAEGCDRMVKFGDGSPFFDVVLPCGGGISVAIHLLRSATALEHVIECLGIRKSAGLAYSPSDQTLSVIEAPERASWSDGSFIRSYHPRTRVVISGRAIEVRAVVRLAEVSGFDIITAGTGRDGVDVVPLIDPFTAVVLLHHDVDAEMSLLRTALDSEAFYIGALGSSRTHRRRMHELMHLGISKADIERIKAPIGLFGPAKDASTLALSVLADIASVRLACLSSL
ncbi:XdhC family protein [Agrobacterium sp. MOPV5]|uniref:XdhC family protein n=1 Tax=Agrobacterium leguminum TaxID=2792015 RepID=UPI0018C2223A|nr:XdhC family protein [Agrobacterium leguminum]MBG0511606.1 XdhC family protein [Agrobacterium leguminum]